ncbi:MBL fold metallo-hydrolase [Carnobacterium antarcticum]|uniref:MBL fold metallo-hydrolase n=1 Tax=Carnobacterium antarcticum TaxID=2126436 RepID=A0ABW4NLB4_9LACT|nr:MBL fold metallo-hydrolase [Carnobacterium sp. CP1]ALV21604.1 metallo-beta-lactamase family protein [Carnobacterium sp. CP1]
METGMHYGKDYKTIPATSVKSGEGVEVVPDVYCYTVQIVNLCFIGDSATNEFVIVDTGTPNRSKEIIAAAEERFGPDCRPKAIILTHGHFDHVGSVIELINHWHIPAYAHPLEMPYLTGQKNYPEPDYTVEGGLVAKMSPIFPIDAIDLDGHVKLLPEDGSVPYLSAFKWIHVPGHAPGQVALFREEDRLLLAADAFVTVKQEDLYKVITQKQEISGPPRYLTTDWKAAKNSVIKLAELKPNIAITGHGKPMTGDQLSESLDRLVRDFDEIAVPKHGRYVSERNET